MLKTHYFLTIWLCFSDYQCSWGSVCLVFVCWKYSWPWKNTGLNCVSPLIYRFFPVNTVNVCSSLSYDFLSILSSFIVRIQYMLHTVYEICCLRYWVNSNYSLTTPDQPFLEIITVNNLIHSFSHIHKQAHLEFICIRSVQKKSSHC